MSEAPSRRDRKGVKRRRVRADREPSSLSVTLEVRVRRGGVRRDADGNLVAWFVCAMTREERAEWDRRERAADHRSLVLQLSNAAARAGRAEPPSTLAVRCWCERVVVYVPAIDVSLGQTGSCGSPDCTPWLYGYGDRSRG